MLTNIGITGRQKQWYWLVFSLSEPYKYFFVSGAKNSKQYICAKIAEMIDEAWDVLKHVNLAM